MKSNGNGEYVSKYERLLYIYRSVYIYIYVYRCVYSLRVYYSSGFGIDLSFFVEINDVFV